MRAEEFPALLGGMELPGVEVAPADGQPGSGLNLGFLVTAPSGARMAWQVVLTVDGADPIAAEPLEPLEMPTLTEAAEHGRLALPEITEAICAWISRSPAAPFVADLRMYRAVHREEKTRMILREIYGIRLALHNGDMVRLQLLWALRPGEGPTPGNKYRPLTP